MFLLLLNLIHFDVGMTYALQPAGIAITAALFGGIFVLTCCCPIWRQVVIAKPIELLRGGQCRARRSPRPAGCWWSSGVRHAGRRLLLSP